MVRLGARFNYESTFMSEQRVSIPVWFDWELVQFQRGQSSFSFQFQYGSIGSPVKHQKINRMLSIVSIPVWFDWEFLNKTSDALQIL